MEVGLQIFQNEELVMPTHVEHNDELVLTTEQLAKFYGTSPDNIKKNFNANKERFVEGKHYFKIEDEELKDFKNRVTESYLVGKNANMLYLWTKRGAARHAKMLTTDRAWEVFELLEENYFSAKATNANIESIIKQLTKDLPMTPEQRQRFESLIPVIALQVQAIIMQKIVYCENHEVTAEDLAVLDLPGEIWRWIKNFEGWYQISTKGGRLRSYHRGKVRLIKPKINEEGYYQIGLYKDGKTYCKVLNQLVAQAFIPNPDDKPEVDHRDNNPLNNDVENLRWATRKENAEYAAETGRYRIGENHGNAVLTAKLAKEIYDSYIPHSKEFGIKALAQKYGVSRSTIENIVYGKTWTHATLALPVNAEIVAI